MQLNTKINCFILEMIHEFLLGHQQENVPFQVTIAIDEHPVIVSSSNVPKFQISLFRKITAMQLRAVLGHQSYEPLTTGLEKYGFPVNMFLYGVLKVSSYTISIVGLSEILTQELLLIVDKALLSVQHQKAIHS